MSYKSNITNIVSTLAFKMNALEADLMSNTGLKLEIASGLQGNNLRRIHNQGNDTSGKPILKGRYSTKDMLVGAKSFPTKAGATVVMGSKAKRKANRWVTIQSGGKNRHLMVLEGGYKKLREVSGRQTGFVDLNLTGKLKTDYGIGIKGNDVVVGFTTEYAIDIAKGMEKRNGRSIWGLGVGDNAWISAVIKRYINAKLK